MQLNRNRTKTTILLFALPFSILMLSVGVYATTTPSKYLPESTVTCAVKYERGKEDLSIKPSAIGSVVVGPRQLQVDIIVADQRTSAQLEFTPQEARIHAKRTGGWLMHQVIPLDNLEASHRFKTRLFEMESGSGEFATLYCQWN